MYAAPVSINSINTRKSNRSIPAISSRQTIMSIATIKSNQHTCVNQPYMRPTNHLCVDP